ncbi:protein FAM131A-like [Carcharodon carcharias]|uniref:protein FAM131A-like n=1 Tax=Carcharodon carcharias TaxID=13397 RepID=UPI001B7E3435|nr:protein FAM131A-like [Carcharodon carcharias]
MRYCGNVSSLEQGLIFHLKTPIMGCIGSKTTIVAVDTTLRVEWKEVKSAAALFPLGNTTTSLVRRLAHQTSVDSPETAEVNVEDTIEMLPKSRRALTIQEIAALARSSLHGFSQVVKDHVTKPTAMAQGRVAHLIEWKGWCKPMESPMTLEIDFNSYSDLSEGEQEARFAAGVAEQFEIAEAKLKAWSSVDGDDSNDDSYDEDFVSTSDSTLPADAAGQYPQVNYSRDMLHSHLCKLTVRQASCEQESDSSQTVSPETLCSSLCSLEDHPLLKMELGSPTELAAKLFGQIREMTGHRDVISQLQPNSNTECAFRNLICEDSSYSVSYAESCFTPEEDDLSCQDYKTISKEEDGEYDGRRKVSDVASSGVVSLEEDDAEDQ